MRYHDLTRTSTRGAATLLLALAFAGGTAAAALAGGGSGGVGTADEGTTTTAGEGTTADASADGVFPVRGRHSYGDGLGAGRNHQGQDILAKCGKRVLAAQPGRVEFRDSDGGAGNYVVIDGRRGVADTVYMHLRGRAKVRRGERVRVGDLIGRVGSTGSASACHLHFEMWSSPGWSKGGKPIAPKPYLKRWDRAS